jgi:hypothetical protein
MDRPRLVTSSDTPPVAADDRPFDHSPVTTAELPPTPVRDRQIPATAWTQAPDALLQLGEALGVPPERTAYKRRIGDWLLWRAGPARGPARYFAAHADDLTRQVTFDLNADGTHHGVGPSGTTHDRFRSWKEDLLGRKPSN